MFFNNRFLCVLFFSISHLISQLFINNEWHESCSGRKTPVYNPATGKLLCEVEEADSVSILQTINKSHVPLYEQEFTNEGGGVSSLRHVMLWEFSSLLKVFLGEYYLHQIEALKIDSVVCCTEFKAPRGKFVIFGYANKIDLSFVTTSSTWTSCRKMWTRQWRVPEPPSRWGHHGDPWTPQIEVNSLTDSRT